MLYSKHNSYSNNAYGAIEVKSRIVNHTYTGFFSSLGLIIILFAMYFAFPSKPIPTTPLEAPFSPGRIDVIPQVLIEKFEIITESAIAHSKIIKIGIDVINGDPIPIPDMFFPEDSPEFTDVINAGIAYSKTGYGIKTDENPLISGIREDINTLKIEKAIKEVPFKDFIVVEKEPTVDLVGLQKRIKYPILAIKAGIEGTVFVRVLIGKDGDPIKATIISSENDMLNKAAIDAVMGTVFTPAIQNSSPVVCPVNIPIRFRLK